MTHANNRHFMASERIGTIWGQLRANSGVDFSIAFLLGTGLYPYQQRAYIRGGVVAGDPEVRLVASKQSRLLRILPEFLPILMDRVNYLESIRHHALVSMGEKVRKREVLPTEAQVSERLNGILEEHGWSSKDPFWRIRLSVLIRMADEGWTADDMSLQLGIPYEKVKWVWDKKIHATETFWRGVPEPEREAQVQAWGRSTMIQLGYLTDPKLCQVYETVNRLEAHIGWRKPCMLVRTMLGAGLRLSEAINLKAQDIVLEYDPPVIYVRRGKGGRSRTAQVIPELGPHLVKYLEDMPETLHRYLFPAVNWANRRRLIPLSPINPRTGWEWWKKVMAQAGVEGTHPHMARHTFATWEAERLPLFVLKDTLGHTTLATTEKFYRHGIIGRNYSKEPPKWRELAALEPKRNESYKDPILSRFVKRSMMVQL